MKSILRTLFFALFLALFCLPSTGQGPQNKQHKMEQYRSMKIAYFTENLELTPEEAEKFWPLYNEYDRKKHELRRENRTNSRQFSQQTEQLSDQEVEEIMDRLIENRKKDLQLDIEFHDKLKTILPSKKIMKLYITEIRFREYMLKKIREERPELKRKRERDIP